MTDIYSGNHRNHSAWLAAQREQRELDAANTKQYSFTYDIRKVLGEGMHVPKPPTENKQQGSKANEEMKNFKIRLNPRTKSIQKKDRAYVGFDLDYFNCVL